MFIALGLATVDLLWLMKPGVTPSQRVYYHWHGDPAHLAVSTAIDVLVLWVVLTLTLVAARSPGRLRVAVWTGLVLFLPWIAFQDCFFILEALPRRRYSILLFAAAFLATSLVTAFWRPFWTARFEQLVDSASTVLVFAGAFGCFLLCRLAWYGYEAHRAEYQSGRQAMAQRVAPGHRVIWILMDELSYDQVFGRRFPGLKLPTFDAFAHQATNFTHVQSPGMYTQIVVPGILTGQSFDDIRTPIAGPLWAMRTGKWIKFDPHDTIFQDALNGGYSTAVVGWYNPYCRMASEVLDSCFWTFRDTLTTQMITSGTVLANAVRPLYVLRHMLLTATPQSVERAIERRYGELRITMQVPTLHIEDYRDLYGHADRLMRDPSAGFVFLHLPVPHPYGIYDRTRGDFTATDFTSSSYIDNLALADRCLGGLRLALEQTGDWDSSTVIVMGDHGWRAGMWQMQKKFYPDEEAASSGGQFDTRPAYIVKLPGQTVGARIDTPFHSANTRKLLDAVFDHKIVTPADLRTWATANP